MQFDKSIQFDKLYVYLDQDVKAGLEIENEKVTKQIEWQ